MDKNKAESAIIRTSLTKFCQEIEDSSATKDCDSITAKAKLVLPQASKTQSRCYSSYVI